MVKAFLAFISVFLSVFCTSRESNREMKYANISFPISLSEIESLDCGQKTIISLSKLNLRNIHCRKELSDSLYTRLINLNLINKWDHFLHDPYNIYPDNYEEFLSVRKNEMSLYSIGRIKISSHFSSYGILIEEDYNNSEFSNDEFINRRLVILNIKDQEVNSLYEGFGYSLLSGHSSYKSIIRYKGNYYYFFYFHDLKSCKQLINEMNSDEIEYCSFSFDRNGKIKNVL